MDYLNYFGFEETLSGVLELFVFFAFLMLYLATRGARVESWKKYFNYSMGLISLTYLLPFSLGVLSVFWPEDFSEKYFGIIHIASYSVPTLLALVCFIFIYKEGFKNS